MLDTRTIRNLHAYHDMYNRQDEVLKDMFQQIKVLDQQLVVDHGYEARIHWPYFPIALPPAAAVIPPSQLTGMGKGKLPPVQPMLKRMKSLAKTPGEKRADYRRELRYHRREMNRYRYKLWANLMHHRKATTSSDEEEDEGNETEATF